MAAIAAAAVLVISLLTSMVSASSIVKVTSNIADVPGGASLVLTIGTQNDGDVHELEVDHTLYAQLPEFSVYADEADPYGGATCGPSSDQDCRTQFENAGVEVTYSAAENQWVIDFGDAVTDVIRNNGQINFHFVLRDANRNILWGSMDLPAPESTFRFDAIEGTGDSLLVEVDQDNDVVIPGVPNTSVGQ